MIGIQQFKDLHKGRRAFFIGNGPSIRETPLHLLNNEITFALNNIADYWTIAVPETTWRPQYYYNSTKQSIRYKGWLDKAKQAIEACHIAFIRNESPIEDAPNVVRFTYEGAVCPTCRKQMPVFSLDISRRVNHYRMSMFGMAQIAVYMGIEKIIYLGCDLGYTGSGGGIDDPNHFSPEYAGDFVYSNAIARKENWHHFQSHLALRSVYKRLGVTAYNATIGGELDVYPRVSLEDVLAEKELRYI